MEYKTGFLFTINISQRDVLEFDLNLDLTDMAIYALFKHIAISDASRRIYESGKVFYQFSRQFIIDQLPIIGINTKSGISKRLQNLVAAKILVPYERNKTEGISYFCFGEMHGVLHDRSMNSGKVVDNAIVTENEHLSTNGYSTYQPTDIAPINFGTQYNSTIDKLHNNKEVEDKQKKTVAKKTTDKPQQTEQEVPTTTDETFTELAGSSEFIWRMRHTSDAELNAKLTTWAFTEILSQLPAICTKHGKQYTDEQLQAWTKQQLTTDKVNVLKTTFSMYGEPLHSDTVKHLLNRANWQLRERGGLDIAAVAVKPQTKRNVNYETPFK